MKPDTDDRDPIEVLYDIETAVDELGTDSELSDLEPRMEMKEGTNKYELLKFINKNGPVTSEECNEVVDTSQSRVLTELYRGYCVDRDKINHHAYEYMINEVGENALDYVDSEQSKITSTENQNEKPAKPWDATPASKGEYYALKCIYEADDSPHSKEIDEEFKKQSGLGTGSNNGPTVTPYLSTAFQKDLVGRTPTHPYRYWVNEHGKEVLDN